MATLFNQTRQNISLHINNCFREGELELQTVVKESLTTANDGKMYKTKWYNLVVPGLPFAVPGLPPGWPTNPEKSRSLNGI